MDTGHGFELPDLVELAGIGDEPGAAWPRLVSVRQLSSAGISRARVRRLVREGTLVPLARGFYSPAGILSGQPVPAGEASAQEGRDDWASGPRRGTAATAGGAGGATATAPEGGPGRLGAGAGKPGTDGARAGAQAGELLRLSAALAPAVDGAAGSHQSAAIIHGLDLLRWNPAGDVVITRPRGSTGSRTGRPGVRVHAAALPAAHVTTRGGVRVTSAGRTVADLARALPFREGVVVADSALHAGQVTRQALISVIGECPGWPGIRRARDVVAFSDGRSESVFESISRVAFRDQGIPPPELQVLVGSDDVVIGRVDFLWRQYGTIGEADGALKYADPARARVQLRRDAMLREAGFEVVHFTWQEIMCTPDRVAAGIRSAFRRAVALGGWTGAARFQAQAAPHDRPDGSAG